MQFCFLKMFELARSFGVSLLFVFSAKCTLVSPPSAEQTIRQCLLSTPAGSGSMGQCFGMGVLSKLQSWDNEPEFDLVDGFTLTRDPKEYREGYSFADSDPSSFRSIIDSIGQVFSGRQMRWDMSAIYPGLIMQIAPSPGTAGYLQFALDPHKQAANRHTLKEASTGRYSLFLLGAHGYYHATPANIASVAQRFAHSTLFFEMRHFANDSTTKFAEAYKF